MKETKPYDVKYLLKCLRNICLMILLLKATGGNGLIVLLPVALFAVSRRKAESVLFCFLLTITMTMCGRYLVPKGGIYGYAMRAITMSLGFIAMVQISGRKKSPLVTPFLVLLLYLFYMFVPSINGWCPTISIMKLILFIVVYCAYIGVANSAIEEGNTDHRRIRSIMLSVAIFFVLGSILSIPFPAVSIMMADQYMNGEIPVSLFQGVTSHSQCLGPLVAVIAVIVYADLLYNVRRPDRLYLAILLCAPLLIYKTSSRTAMGSWVAGMMIVTFFFMKMRNVNMRWRSKVVSVLLLLVSLIAAVTLSVPRFREGARGFILKFDKEQQGKIEVSDITKSRLGKWESTLYNFKKKPEIGNGFQVSEEMAYMEVDGIFSVLSAPVEKGVWITAVLEEGGIMGMCLFVCFILVVGCSLYKRNAYTGLATFAMLIITNLGEFTIFSLTYTGGILWALVFVGVIMDGHRIRQNRAMAQVPCAAWRS